MSHQDWTPIVLRSSSATKKAENALKVPVRRAASADPLKKKLEADLVKSDEAPDLAPLPHLDSDNRKRLTQARINRSLTQEALAKQINIQPKIINDLESGRVINDKTVLQKINKILGISPTIKFAK